MTSGDTDDRKRVLISDNEPNYGHALTLYFEAEGYAARASQDLLESLELAVSWQPHVIITDIYKSESVQMQGIEMTRQLKADDRTKHIPVIVASAGGADPESRQQAFDAGAVAVVAPSAGLAEPLRHDRPCHCPRPSGGLERCGWRGGGFWSGQGGP